jgi:hypothetical protein
MKYCWFVTFGRQGNNAVCSQSTGWFDNECRRGHGCMVVGFITTGASSELWVRTPFMARCTRYNMIKSRDKVCQWLTTGRWFSPVSSTNKTNRHDITEIYLKVALNTINQTNKNNEIHPQYYFYTNRTFCCFCVYFVIYQFLQRILNLKFSIWTIKFRLFR